MNGAVPQRRLPLYLVLDVSGSMSGERIESLTEGVHSLLAALQGDRKVREMLAASVLAFDSYAREVRPLAPLPARREETLTLEARGATSLGEGLELLMRCIARDVRLTAPTGPGD